MVYRAKDLELGRWVAVKCLFEATTSHTQDLAAQEAKTLASLQHPNIMTIYDILYSDNQVWIVSEWIDGICLSDLKQPLPTEVVLAIMAQVYAALGAAHSAKIIHRDVKPSNVLISNNGRVSLIDFGVAFAPGVSTGATIVGSLRYTDPRTLEGAPANGHSDLFSAAMLQVELMSGEKVLPDLAPLPMYRHLKKNLEQRVNKLTEGDFPPLTEIARAITHSTWTRTDDGCENAKKYSEQLKEYVRILTDLEPETFLAKFFDQSSHPLEETSSRVQELTATKIADSQLGARSKSSWIAFRNNQQKQPPTKTAAPKDTSWLSQNWQQALISSSAIAIAMAAILFWNSPKAIDQTPTPTPQKPEVAKTIKNEESSKESNNVNPDLSIATAKRLTLGITPVKQDAEKPLVANSAILEVPTKTTSAAQEQIKPNNNITQTNEEQINLTDSEPPATTQEPAKSLLETGKQTPNIGKMIAENRSFEENTPASHTIDIDESVIKNIVNPEANKAKLWLEANSPATVVIDGQDAGTLPAKEAFLLAPGNHIIEVFSPYFEPASLELKLEEEESKKFRFSLKPKVVSKKIILATPGQLFVNGIDYGEVKDKTLQLAYGKHDVWIKRKDEIIKPNNFEITPDTPDEINIELEEAH